MTSGGLEKNAQVCFPTCTVTSHFLLLAWSNLYTRNVDFPTPGVPVTMGYTIVGIFGPGPYNTAEHRAIRHNLVGHKQGQKLQTFLYIMLVPSLLCSRHCTKILRL